MAVCQRRLYNGFVPAADGAARCLTLGPVTAGRSVLVENDETSAGEDADETVRLHVQPTLSPRGGGGARALGAGRSAAGEPVGFGLRARRRGAARPDPAVVERAGRSVPSADRDPD